MKTDTISMYFEDSCPYQVGQHVTGPIIDHRGIHHGFPGVGEIISVERQKSRFDSKTRFYVKLKVSLPF